MSGLCFKVIQTIASFILLGTLFALIKAISHWRRNISPSKGPNEELTHRQLRLLGLKPKVNVEVKESPKKPPKSKFGSPSNALFPLHEPLSNSANPSRMSGAKSISNRVNSFRAHSNSPTSPSVYLVPTPSTRSPASAKSPSLLTSSTADHYIGTPWSNKRTSFHKEVASEQEFEKFLADVDDKLSETMVKLATPPSSINVFGVTSPNTVASSVNTSGTRRSTPLRPVRMSPGSQKFTTPPKKGEADLPTPMSIEESTEAFGRLGMYPCIEQWRDRLRQWFSDTVLNSLLSKIETSHLKVRFTN